MTPNVGTGKVCRSSGPAKDPNGCGAVTDPAPERTPCRSSTSRAPDTRRGPSVTLVRDTTWARIAHLTRRSARAGPHACRRGAHWRLRGGGQDRAVPPGVPRAGCLQGVSPLTNISIRGTNPTGGVEGHTPVARLRPTDPPATAALLHSPPHSAQSGWKVAVATRRRLPRRVRWWRCERSDFCRYRAGSRRGRGHGEGPGLAGRPGRGGVRP